MPDPISGGLLVGGAVLGGQVLGAKNGADAAKDAANIQAQAGSEAIAAGKEASAIARADQQPFTQFGASNIPALQALLTPDGQQSFLQNSPIFQAALKNANTATVGNAAVRGRLNSGDTQARLAQNYTATALPFLQQQQSSLFNALQLGQAAASGQAANTLQTGANAQNLITDIGAARGAGLVGRANAINQGINGLTSLATFGLGAA